jgi:hypothetical protein
VIHEVLISRVDMACIMFWWYVHTWMLPSSVGEY